MRKLIPAIGAFIASGLLAGATLADGLPESIKDTPMEGPQWSGFYMGAGVGYGHGVIDNTYTDTGGASQVLEGDGLRGGLGTVILGLDRRVGERLVVGAFVDFDWTSIEIAFRDATLGEQTLRLDWMWAAGVRAGYLLTQSTLLYVAGGYTHAEFKNRGFNDITVGPDTLVGRSKISHDGFFVAAGMEAMLGRGFSLRGELRYSDFNEEISNSGPIGGVDIIDRSEPTLLTGRLVLTYKFGDRRHYEPLK